MDTSLSAALGLGFVLGIRHAMDADHMAAVSTLVSQHRSLRRSCLLGTFWGLGHTLALLAAGIATIGLRLSISPELERTFERGVGCVLILLGAHVLLRSLATWRLHPHEQAHGDHSHRHLHRRPDAVHGHDHARLLRMGGRPFLVGLLHGMAGSAALMLLVVAAIPSPVGGFLYILVFGAGSTVGMLVLSGLIGLPFVVTTDRSPRALVFIQILAGVTSGVLGLTLLWAPSSVT
jgi:ABC-type nickel/cobalt efflux system permease component RcnA